MNHSIKPAGKHWRDFIASMEATTMTPQQRTTFNGVIKQYKAMMDIDYKTQDRYEEEIAGLRRQVEKTQGELLLAKKVIHEGADDEEETPLPILHMMARCDEAETKHQELHRQILLACCDSPDLNAVASIAHEQHKASGVKPDDVMSEDTIYDLLGDDVAQKEGLVDEDAIDYGPAYDNGKQEGYQDGIDEGQEIGEDRHREQVLDQIEELFKPLMSRVVEWEKEYDWDDQLRQIAERMEHHIMCQEAAETACEEWDKKCQELKEEVVELKKKIAKEE